MCTYSWRPVPSDPLAGGASGKPERPNPVYCRPCTGNLPGPLGRTSSTEHSQRRHEQHEDDAQSPLKPNRKRPVEVHQIEPQTPRDRVAPDEPPTRKEAAHVAAAGASTCQDSPGTLAL